MSILDRDQLETLKHQIEEEYRLDLAAIERLQRRYFGQGATASPATSSSRKNGPAPEIQGQVLPKIEPAGIPSDELTGSIRAMFSGLGK